MSTLKVNNIQNANGTSAIAIDSSGVATFSKTLVPSSSMMYRNLIINGDMRIAQRGTSFTGTTSGIYSLDRMLHNLNAGTWTITQDTDVPTGQGFAKSLKMACTTAKGSLSAGDVIILGQRFEGQNLTRYIKGTNAVQTTVSFWIKSNKTGTYTTEQYDFDNGRQISRTFTIDSANTWEKKTITLAADTGGSNFDCDNALSLEVNIWLGAGSNHTSGTFTDNTWAAGVTANRVSSSNVNLADSTSNYINVTGWQLEVGDAATPFEHRQYGAELALCQRYFETSFAYGQAVPTSTFDGMVAPGYNQASSTTGEIGGQVNFQTKKRATPTVTIYDQSSNSGKLCRTLIGVGNYDNQTASVANFNDRGGLVYGSGNSASYVRFHFKAEAEL